MNAKNAETQLIEAQHLLKQAGDLLRQDDVSDDDRARAADLRDRAKRMKTNADLMRQIETEAKGALVAEVAAAQARQTEWQAAAEGKFRSFGEFISALVRMKKSGTIDPRIGGMFTDGDDARQQKALSGEEGALGGFLIPEQFIPNLQTVMVEGSTALARVTRLPMSTRTVTFPVIDYTQSLPAGEPRQFGGVQAFYENESAELEESEPKFRDFTLTAHELTVYTEANNSLLADAALSLEAFLNSDMGMIGAARWKTDYKILRGTGVGQPLGILNAGATLSVPRGTANTVTFTDLANMEEAAIPSSRLEWRAHITLKAKLRDLRDTADRLLWTEARDGFPATLLGYPIEFTEKLPNLGTRGDLLLADFSYYLYGDRQAPTLNVSDQANFRRNRMAYRLILRHDGRPWMNAPLTLSDAQTQVSPFVVLGTA